MFGHSFVAVLVGTLIVADAAVSDDRDQKETKKSDPQLQLVFKVKGLT
jgi:hypothetical protein